MRHAWILGCLLLLTACSNKVTDSAVALTIKYQSYTPVCLRVTAADATAPERKSDELIPQSKLAADEDRTLILAVYREKGWNPQLQVDVASYATPDCTGSAIETRGLPAMTLPAQGSIPAKVELLAQDGDQDGHAATTLSDSAIHGTDCNDGKANVHPGAVAVCDGAANLNTDIDCDGKVDCNGSTCTSDAMCGSGFCVGGICCDNACNTPPSCHAAGVCGTGTCVYPVATNAMCDDGNACTINDKCDAQAVCAGSVKACNTPPGQCYANAGTCNASTGACDYSPLPSTTSCNDGSACTAGDKCNGSGTCTGTPKVCGTPPGQCYASSGTCNASTGACDYSPLPATTTCDDGKICTDGDKCDGSGTCGGTMRTCNTPPNDCYASAGACNASTGACDYSTLPSNAACSDGKACTSDKCNGTGTCVSTTSCPPPNECKKAAAVACAADGSCQFDVDVTQVGKVCHESGNTGTCLPDGTCRSFKYTVTANFDPADIAANNTLGDLDVACDATLNSSGTPSWSLTGCSFVTPTPVVTSDGIVVVPVRNLMVNGTLRVVGSRPVVLAVYGDATLNNDVLANSLRTEVLRGAGSGVGCTSRQAGSGSHSGGDGSGGGGGGFATVGGSGGANDDGSSTGGGGGGVAPGGFAPLLGGCEGGDGAGPGGTTPGVGGAGGGGLQLSVAGRLTLKRLVSVSGAGGTEGTATTSKTAGGGGGGSGGMLVLEADQLVVDAAARLTANGGAGGEGGSGGLFVLKGNPGANGSTLDATPAAGGAGGTDDGGNGGAGAAGSSGPVNGAAGRNTNSSAAGGGGGGAAGRILLRGVTSCSGLPGGIISPAYNKTGGVCP